MPFKDKEKYRAYFAARNQTPEHKAYMRAYRLRPHTKERYYAANLKDLYGITLEQYKAIFQAQDGKCAICGIPANQLKKRLGVDHNHATGKVRGLLCVECNHGIGKLKDSSEVLKNAMMYLLKHEWEQYAEKESA